MDIKVNVKEDNPITLSAKEEVNAKSKLLNEFYNGKSAYEVAVENGYIGTETEWLESLKGKDGTMSFEDLTPEQKATLKGDKGDKGDDGYTPIKNIDYFDGYTPVKGVDYFDGEKGEKGDTYTITETDYQAIAQLVPGSNITRVSQLENDSGYVTSAYHDSSKQDKITSTNKLAYSLISGTPTIPSVPTNVSAFTNDVGYLTDHQDISGKQDKITSSNKLDYSLLANTPSIPSDDHINSLIDIKLGDIENGTY